MAIRLRSRTTATGVAVITPAGSAGIVEPRPSDERCSGMTEVAIQRGLNVVVTHTFRRHPVAGRAIVHDARVIKHRPDEGRCVMADTAILVC